MDYEINEMASELEAELNPDVMDDQELQGIVGNEIDDAVDFIDNWISPIRATATQYYRGEPFGDEEEGRSQVVSMDVRDTVQAIIPSLMRIFNGSDRTVEYVPQTRRTCRRQSRPPNTRISSSTATTAASWRCTAPSWTHWCARSASSSATGKTRPEFETIEYTGVDDNALAALMADPAAEVDITVSTPMGEAQIDPMTGQIVPPPMAHDLRVTYTHPDGRVKVEALPPEEFLISREAKSVEDADYVAHRRIVTVSELVAMGYDYDDVYNLSSDHDDMDTNVERNTRNPALTNEMNSRSDPAMRKVLYVENYIRVDFDGDGIAELRKICTGGDGNVILSNEPCAMAPFATLCPDPEPHDFFGLSIFDAVADIQRIKSVIMRNSLDSLSLSIHPRIAVVEGMVNMDDAMNTEMGSIVRQRAPGSVQQLTVPFVGQQAFPVLQYMDEVKEARTGISKASMGLDAGALQSSTATAVAATVSAAQQHIEMIARVFAETGVKRLYELVLYNITTHQDKARMIRLNNDFVEMDPRVWNANMDVSVNVALGRGTDTERMMMLRQISEMQKEAMSTMGPQNPLTDISKLSNTLKEMTSLAGFKDTSQFWSDPAKFQPPPPDNKPDINEQLIQVQIQQIQSDMQKKAAELQLKREQMIMEDDRKRDELEADIRVKAEEMKAKYGTQLDVAQIRADMAINREVMKAQADIITEAARED